MLEHCDEGSAVVLVAAVVVVSEDMVADEGPWASAFASLGVQALGAPHQGNYCFGYCSSYGGSAYGTPSSFGDQLGLVHPYPEGLQACPDGVASC